MGADSERADFPAGAENERAPLLRRGSSSVSKAQVSPEAEFVGSRKVHAWIVLCVVLLAYITNQMDRAMLGYVQADVRRDLHLTSGEYALLAGYGFSLVFVIAGMPLGRLVDRWQRRWLLLLGLVVWSGVTAAAGLSQTFGEFLAARIGVGLGEAACNPAAFPLIADYFPPAHRPLANAVYNSGIYIGGAMATVAEAVSGRIGWRWTYGAYGFAGLGVAAVMFAVVKEPPRGRYSATQRTASHTLSATVRYLITLDSAWIIAFAAGIRSLGGYVFGYYVFARLDAIYGHLTYYYAACMCAGGVVASYAGGHVTRAWSARNHRAAAHVPALGAVLSCPFVVLFLYAEDIVGTVNARSEALALVSVFLAYATAEVWGGPAASIYQSILPPGMQGSGFGIYFFILTLLGGAGPEICGLFDTEHINGLTVARADVLAGLIVGSYVVCAAAFVAGGAFVEHDLRRRERFEATRAVDGVSHLRYALFVVGVLGLVALAGALMGLSFRDATK